MPARLECAKCTFSMLGLWTKNCNVFSSWTPLSGTTCFPFYNQKIVHEESMSPMLFHLSDMSYACKCVA